MVVKKVFSSATVALTSLSLAFAPTPPAAPPRYDAPPTGNLSVQERPLTEPLAPLGVVEAPEPEPLGPQPSPAPPLTPQQEQAVLAATGEANAAQRAVQRSEVEAAEADPEPQAEGEAEHVHDVIEPSALQSPRSIWDNLADCESGNWISGGASFETGSARWHVGGTDHRAQKRPPWSNGLFYGGVQFTLKSWAWAADVGGHNVDPNPANNSREEQIAVAETLKSLQGPNAWPTCGPKVGLR